MLNPKQNHKAFGALLPAELLSLLLLARLSTQISAPLIQREEVLFA